jgi:hypothetical protein
MQRPRLYAETSSVCRDLVCMQERLAPATCPPPSGWVTHGPPVGYKPPAGREPPDQRRFPAERMGVNVGFGVSSKGDLPLAAPLGHTPPGRPPFKGDEE